MTRSELFERLRPLKEDRRFTVEDVVLIDAIADDLGMGRLDGDRGMDKALDLIKQFEGCELEAYPDPGSGGDPWTVGYGATGPGIKKGVRWTQAQADARLTEDVARFMAGVNKLVPRATDAQRGAMTSLAYNIGLGAFGDSTLLKLHNAGDYAGAAAQFGRWNRAAGVVMKGLTRRRAAEAAVYRGQA